MNIRTKLALALVAASLSSMAALGYFAYVSSSQLLSEISERQLDALAESKKRDLSKVVDGWRENVRLIRSRTRLHEMLAMPGVDVVRNADLDRIIGNVVSASRNVRRVTLFDLDGKPLSSSGTSIRPAATREVAGDAVPFSGFHIEADDTLGVVFHSNLLLDGEGVGVLETVFRAESVRAITDDFTGLGQTGETYIVAIDREQHYLVLNPLRHDGDSPRGGSLTDAPAAAAAALVGHEGVLASSVADYRGEPVVAATRSLPELGWGIVVKIDMAEEDQRAQQLVGTLRDVWLSIGALAILGGTLLGFQLARPIRELAHIVDLARDGDTGLRASEHGDDEVAFLARSINELLDQTQELSERKPKE